MPTRSATSLVTVLMALALAGCGLHPEGEHEDVVMGPNVSIGPIELLSVVPAENAIRAGQAACSYS